MHFEPGNLRRGVLIISSARPSLKYSLSLRGSCLRRGAPQSMARRLQLWPWRPRSPLQLLHRLEPMEGLLVQASLHNAKRSAETSGAGRIVAQDRAHDLRGRVSPERTRARRHFIEDCAKAEDVGTRIEIAPLPVPVTCRARAEHGPRHCLVTSSAPPSTPSSWPDRSRAASRDLACDQDVGWLRVPMQDAAPCAASSALAICRARRRLSARIGPRQVAVDILEHEIIGPDVVELTDVGMVERGNRPRFLLEAALPIGPGAASPST